MQAKKATDIGKVVGSGYQPDAQPVLDFLAYNLGKVAFLDTAGQTEEIDQGGVRGISGVRIGVAFIPGKGLGGDGGPELLQQPTFPSACSAGDADDGARPLSNAGGPIQQAAHLRFPADHRPLPSKRPMDLARLIARLQQTIDGHRGRFALYLDRLQGFKTKPALAVQERIRAHQNIALPSHLAQPCGDIDAVPRNAVGTVVGIQMAQYHKPGVDAGMHGQGAPDTRLVKGIQSGNHLVDFPGRPHRAKGVVFVSPGSSENGHGGVADVFFDKPFVALDDAGDFTENLDQDILDLFRVQVFGQGGIAAQIGKQDGDLLTLAFQQSV